jgi:hypothetical protein
LRVSEYERPWHAFAHQRGIEIRTLVLSLFRVDARQNAAYRARLLITHKDAATMVSVLVCNTGPLIGLAKDPFASPPRRARPTLLFAQ